MESALLISLMIMGTADGFRRLVIRSTYDFMTLSPKTHEFNPVAGIGIPR
jgi:hypothetical protein